MTKEDLLKYREYIWNYFQMHADQRLRTFNFYLVVSTILIGAFVNILNSGKHLHFASVLPFILTLISFLFWKLDLRTRQMIKNSELAMKSIDKKIIERRKNKTPQPIDIFAYDDYKLSLTKKNLHWGFFLTYSNTFNALFIVFGTLGIIAGTFYLLAGL